MIVYIYEDLVSNIPFEADEVDALKKFSVRVKEKDGKTVVLAQKITLVECYMNEVLSTLTGRCDFELRFADMGYTEVYLYLTPKKG